MNIQYEISMIAYHYCRQIKDSPKVYKHISDSHWAYHYCRYVKDRPEIYKHITDPYWAYWYCYYVKDRPEPKTNAYNTKIPKRMVNDEYTR